MDKKFLKGYVEKVDSDEGTLSVAIATDSSVDRDGERIDSKGWDFSNFKKNPVLLWAHDYRGTPIGKVNNIRRSGDKILFTPQFAVNASEKAKEVFNLYKDGFLRAFSVGFSPSEWEDKEGKDGMVRTFTKAELLEISAVPVPANPNAIVLARSKGISEDTVKEMEKNIEDKDKTVVPYKNEGKSDIDLAWNVGEEIKEAGDNLEKLRKMSTWFKSDDPQVVTNYKFLHHKASDLRVVWKGVTSSMALLLGVNGGVEIPDEERKGVYDHLAQHYKEFEKEAPEFKLVEAQVLKDINFETDAPAIIQIVNIGEGELKELKSDIEKLKPIAGKNGTDGGDSGKSLKVDPIDELLSSKGTKRLLQIIDKTIGEVLKRAKTNS